MAIKGVGIDAVELSRIQEAMEKTPHIVQRVLTPEEQAVFDTLSEKRQVEYLAGRFAAKEAYAKALGTGIGKNVSFQDVMVLNDPKGQPKLRTSNLDQAQISITHTTKDAYAVVIIEEFEERM